MSPEYSNPTVHYVTGIIEGKFSVLLDQIQKLHERLVKLEEYTHRQHDENRAVYKSLVEIRSELGDIEYSLLGADISIVRKMECIDTEDDGQNTTVQT